MQQMALGLAALVALAMSQPTSLASAQAFDEPLLMVYGADAATAEGDFDHRAAIYISVPADLSDHLFLRVFDADTSGDHDLLYGPGPDSRVRYRLLGGEGAAAVRAAPDGLADDAGSEPDGTVLAERVVGDDAAYDSRWTTVARFAVDAGELVGDRRLFRLAIEGLDGDDGNLFDVAVSTREHRNVAPAGLELLDYAPTVRIPDMQRLTELRFELPSAGQTLRVRNFDAAQGDIALTTATRTVPLEASGQNEWRESQVELLPGEQGVAAVTVRRGNEIPNDVTVMVSDDEGRPLPFLLPPRAWTPNNRPVPGVAATVLADCRAVALDASASSDPDGDALGYIWRFDYGGVATGPVVVHRYAEPGVSTPTLLITDSSGQVGASTLVELLVDVPEAPVADAGTDLVAAPGVPVTFDGTGSRDGSNAIERFIWDFKDGSVGEGPAPTHVFETPGTYDVALRVETAAPDDACGFAVDHVRVHVNAGPVAVLSGPERVAAGDQVAFGAASSYDPDGTIVAYRWDFGDGTRGTAAAVEHVYAAPGMYPVRLTVEDDSGSANSVSEATTVVAVNAPPLPVAGEDRTLAIGELSVFDASGSSDADGGELQYVWDFGDGGGAHGERVTYAYRTPGLYDVTLTVEDDWGTTTSQASDALRVVVNAPPVAEAGDDLVVTSSEVAFDGTGSFDEDGRITTYAWSFGDGSTGEGATPVHVYRKSGVYSVELTVTDDSGTVRNSATDRLQVIVNRTPIADAGPDLVAAPGEELLFDASGSIDPDGDLSTYLWDFRDGNTAEGVRVRHAFEQPGIYLVRLVVQDETGQLGATASDGARVVVNAPPVADAGPDIRAAPGDTVILNAGSSFDPDGTIATYRWDLGDEPGPELGTQITRRYSTPGVRAARLTVIDDSGARNAVAQDDVVIRINHPPVAAAGPDVVTNSNTVTFDGSASADADGDALVFRWDFGDGSPPRLGIRPTHTYAEGGTFPVVLSVDDGTGLANGTDTTAITVSIDRPPIADAGGNKDVCAGDIVVFDGSGSADPEGGLLRYAWDFGDGGTEDIVNPTRVFDRGGLFPVTLEVEDESGFPANRHRDRLVVRVNESPLADAGPDQTVCVGSQVRFDGTGSSDPDGVVDRFSWDFGDGKTGGGDRPVHVFTEPGEHRVLLTITGSQAGQCSNTATDEAVVRVLEAPVARIAAPTLAGVGMPVRFDASASTGASGPLEAFRWDFGDGTTADGAVVEHRFPEPGRQLVTLTVEGPSEAADCGMITAQHAITINAAPIADAGGDRSVAIDEVLVYDASKSFDPDGAIVDYRWDFGDGNTATGLLVRHQYAEGGSYSLTLTVMDDSGLVNSSATDTVTVMVNHSPHPVIEGPAVACVDEALSFDGRNSSDVEGDVGALAWTFGDGSSASGPQVSHSFADPGLYDVTLAVDDGSGLKNARAQRTRPIQINRPPVAVAGGDQLVCPGDPVRFDAGASIDWDGELVGYRWDLGDGTVREGASVEHRYVQPGSYEVVLEVTDGSGSACATASDTVRVLVNAAPVAQAGGDRRGLVGGAHDRVAFDASASSDPDGQPLGFVWEFGDGVSVAGEQVRYGYAAAGSYAGTLTVDDGTGLACGVAVDSFEVVVDERS